MAPASPSDPDPWTPDQESALLRALVHYKPIGLHAHFRMLAIHSALLQSGTTEPDTIHTRIPGIWSKLRTLYDLKALDEREDAVFEGEGKEGKWRDFELGDGMGKEVEGGGGEDGGFEEMMWERRLANGGDGTPGGSEWDEDEKLPTTTETEKADATTKVLTDEARSSPVPSMLGRGTRSTRTKGRVNMLKDETDAESPSTGRASSRRTSKATSEVDDGDVVMEDADEEDESPDASEIGDSNSSEEATSDGEEEKRGSTNKRGRGSGKRGRAGKRGRRGRG